MNFEKLKQKRLEELQNSSNMATDPQGLTEEQIAQEQKQQQRYNEMKNNILSAMLSQEARARLNTIMVAKPEKGIRIEKILIQRGRMYGGGEKISDDEFKQILNSINQQMPENRPKVNFDRRRVQLDSDSD
ncbi:hypothetical protein SNEBB_003762 [Seison nebaliae]|nr:hypothetical protein SNEBB_003762 [Seison nebaliae]